MPPAEPVCGMKVRLGGLLEGWSFRDQDSDQPAGEKKGANLKNSRPEAKLSFQTEKRTRLEFPMAGNKQRLGGRSMAVMIMGGLEIK